MKTRKNHHIVSQKIICHKELKLELIKVKVEKSTDDSEIWQFPCRHCEKAFLTKVGLKVHIGKKHPSRKEPHKFDLKKVKVEKSENTWLPCQHCEKKFLTDGGLKIHVGRKHRSRKEPHKELKTSNVQKSSNSETWLSCQHCDKRFLTKAGLNIHIGRKHLSRYEPDGEF